MEDVTVPVEDEEPCYVISVAASMVGIHPQTLRYYEKVGIVRPSRSQGNVRLYSRQDIRRLRQIQRLVNDLGVNLAGAEVIMRMSERLAEMDRQMRLLRAELDRLTAELE
jgi:MerR family transcriptional regulator/heat shock protein HspR